MDFAGTSNSTPNLADMSDVAKQAQERANSVQALQQMNRTLYLGNIAPTVTDDELKTLFSCMGTVIDVRAAGGPAAEEERSFAFIEYATAEEATAGLALNGMVIKGRPLRVGVAKTAHAVTRETPAHLLLHKQTHKMKEMMDNGTLDETLLGLQEKRAKATKGISNSERSRRLALNVVNSAIAQGKAAFRKSHSRSRSRSRSRDRKRRSRSRDRSRRDRDRDRRDSKKGKSSRRSRSRDRDRRKSRRSTSASPERYQPDTAPPVVKETKKEEATANVQPSSPAGSAASVDSAASAASDGGAWWDD